MDVQDKQKPFLQYDYHVFHKDEQTSLASFGYVNLRYEFDNKNLYIVDKNLPHEIGPCTQCSTTPRPAAIAVEDAPNWPHLTHAEAKHIKNNIEV